MRIVSEKEIAFKTGEVGYLHPWNTTAIAPKPVASAPVPVVNVRKLLEQWNVDRYNMFAVEADKLSLSQDSLRSLNSLWSEHNLAMTFPMRDGFGELTGIRFRSSNGDKWTAKGTHPGLFYSDNRLNRECTFVCEGPTNAAAGLDLGLDTIGLPSRGSGLPFLTALIRRHKIRRIVLLCDNKLKSEIGKEDDGIKSTRHMSKFIPVPHCLLFLPAKDLRDYKMIGGTRVFIDNKLHRQIWIQPKTIS